MTEREAKREAYQDALDYVVKLQNVWARHYQGERLKGMQAAARMIAAGLEDKIEELDAPAMEEPEDTGEDRGLPWDEDSFREMA